MSRHDGGNQEEMIFDDANLETLKEYCMGDAKPEELLRNWGMEDAPGEAPGTGAQRQGSLVGYIVAKQVAGQAVVGEEEVQALRGWFERRD